MPRIFLIRLTFWVCAALSALGARAEEASLGVLASSPTWSRLLHLEDNGTSAIRDPEFFLAGPGGRVDPRAELAATVLAFEQALSPGADANQHAQCRFPARLMWLREQWSGAQRFPSIQCPKWLTWSRGGQVSAVSMVLATGYLGNPASFYGHTLLKFRFSGGPQGSASALGDLTVNYGALMEGRDDPLTYIVKGVFGGYDGGFSDIDYYFHRSQYGETELRDLWEYELELSAREALWVAAHAWEVLGKRYQYFFFRRNCAFRIAELLEIIDAVRLIPSARPWTLPQALLLQAQHGQRHVGLPLIRRVHYEPSRQTRFQASYEVLSAEERSVFSDLALRNSLEPRQAFNALSAAGQRAVVDALLDYHQFTSESKQREEGRQHPMYTAALVERYRLPPGPPRAQARPPTPPHQGRNPSWLQIGIQHYADSIASARGLLIRLRPAYYDALDSEAGHLRDAALVMGDVSLLGTRSGLRLHQFDLIHVDSVSPAMSGLPGDRGDAWRLRLGAEAADGACTDCRVVRLQGDYGRAWRIAGRGYLSWALGGALHEHHRDQGEGWAHAALRALWRPSDQWSVQLEAEHRYPIGARQQPYRVDRIQIRWAPAASQWDVRFRYDHTTAMASARRLQWAWGVYW